MIDTALTETLEVRDPDLPKFSPARVGVDALLGPIDILPLYGGGGGGTLIIGGGGKAGVCCIFAFAIITLEFIAAKVVCEGTGKPEL